MPPRDLQWFEIRDFTPGIQQRVGDHLGQNLPLGSATDATYNCFAAPNGSLQPLPAMTSFYNPTPPENYAAIKDNRYYISGFHVAGPLTGAAAGSGTQSEFHIAWEYFKTGGAIDPQRKYRWERHEIFANPVVVDTLKSIDSAANPPTTDALRGTYFEDVRMDDSDPLNPGQPLVAAAWYDEGGGPDHFVEVYPDPGAPNTNATLAISALPCDLIVAHQGRLVFFEQRGWSHGSPGSWISNEQIWYTNINLPTVEPSVAQTFSTDRMTGIGAVKGVSANEILIVKFQDGGYTVSGDFSNPTVIRLPGVAPTYGATIISKYTPLGLVYAQLGGGVYAWSGGSQSQLLSSVLEDGFWELDLGVWINYHGKFELWRDMIVCPNSWAFDTRTGAWWRLQNKTNTRQFFHYGVDYTGTLYAVSDRIEQGESYPVKSFSNTSRASTYYWVSNYLPGVAGPGRGVTIREVVVESIGHGNITIIFDSGGSDVDGMDPVVFQPNNTIPTIIRHSASKSLSGNVSMQVFVEGDSGGEAPTITSIKVGYMESTPVNPT